jgi:hypothetical protein
MKSKARNGRVESQSPSDCIKSEKEKSLVCVRPGHKMVDGAPVGTGELDSRHIEEVRSGFPVDELFRLLN